MREAMLYEKLEDEQVSCLLCPHQCQIKPGKRGICGVRQNDAGRLEALTYDRLASMAVDPIEKKPLYHVMPGSAVFSFATKGCNLSCLHCQNASLSQVGAGPIGGNQLSPARLIQIARLEGCEIIAATYSEPTVFFELALETAELAVQEGMLSTWVTNGYTSKAARELLIPSLDAANVDLKSFNPKTYRQVCSGALESVLETIEHYKQAGVWVEVTTLVIPDLNDSSEELTSIAQYIASIDPAMPWHISAFHPTYKMLDRPRTPRETLERACEIGRTAGLHYVYTGNLWDGRDETQCPSCQKTVVRRGRMSLIALEVEDGKCTHCGERVHGIWNFNQTI